jgi:hypothetical protein
VATVARNATTEVKRAFDRTGTHELVRAYEQVVEEIRTEISALGFTHG